MCTAMGLAAMTEAKRPGWGVPVPAYRVQEAGYCSNLSTSRGWEAGARPVITKERGQRGQPASDGLMTSCVCRRQGRTGHLHTGETEAASPQDLSQAAEALSVHFWALLSPPPEATDAALSESTAGLKLISAPPQHKFPLFRQTAVSPG